MAKLPQYVVDAVHELMRTHGVTEVADAAHQLYWEIVGTGLTDAQYFDPRRISAEIRREDEWRDADHREVSP